MAFEKIISTKNERIKKVLDLRDRKGRDASGLTLIDGLREIEAALHAKVPIETLFICPELLGPRQEAIVRLATSVGRGNISIFETSPGVFIKIAFGEREEGVIAVARPAVCGILALRLPKDPLVVVVEQVEKPGNLGAILRTCDAAGVDAVLVCDPKTDIYNPNVIRSSLGAVFTVPIGVGSNAEAKLFLVSNSIKTVGTFPEARLPYQNHDFKTGSAIILGSEQIGLSPFWIKHSNIQVTVPMRGRVNSLNVAATAAIIIYEAVRQRQS
jgi:RNA methyltransferase, TrmH family